VRVTAASPRCGARTRTSTVCFKRQHPRRSEFYASPIAFSWTKSFTMVLQMLLCGECYENVYTCHTVTFGIPL
jgi:hypothetical protein